MPNKYTASVAEIAEQAAHCCSTYESQERLALSSAAATSFKKRDIVDKVKKKKKRETLVVWQCFGNLKSNTQLCVL